MPAAAVIREMQALSGIIGRKKSVDGNLSLIKKETVLLEIYIKVEGISKVTVKCVDIGKNTRSESILTRYILTLRDESCGSKWD